MPVVLISCTLLFLGIISYIPGFFELSEQGIGCIFGFLAVFGDGKPFWGILTLGFTVSIVGILLDILNFYRYQSLRDEDLM
ncbi:MAG: hypothetical protein ACRC8K_14845 [Waterburya sp.]